jgi:hypothetical protein
LAGNGRNLQGIQNGLVLSNKWEQQPKKSLFDHGVNIAGNVLSAPGRLVFGKNF